MQEEIDAAAAHVMALTLTDEGPDISSQPSPLWASRNTFQQSRSSKLPDFNTPPADDLIAAVDRLSLSEHAAVKNVPHGSSEPQSHMYSGNIAKKERNHRTTKVLQWLHTVSLCMVECQGRLQNPPSDNVVRELETEVAGLCAIVRSASRHTPSINVRILFTLDRLCQYLIGICTWCVYKIICLM
ncbi:hypothetical protein K439DRAFT_1625532 [Ramaria rubella]|nr:hypothetical protein K439DRAFT_1625532 [Ramaria rubella]